MSECTDDCMNTMKAVVNQAFDDYNDSGHKDYHDAQALKDKIDAAMEAATACVNGCSEA